MKMSALLGLCFKLKSAKAMMFNVSQDGNLATGQLVSNGLRNMSNP